MTFLLNISAMHALTTRLQNRNRVEMTLKHITSTRKSFK